VHDLGLFASPRQTEAEEMMKAMYTLLGSPRVAHQPANAWADNRGGMSVPASLARRRFTRI
jgi:hypothetical protein